MSGQWQREPSNRWKSQLERIAEQFRYHSPLEPAPPKFPAGRELIYIVEMNPYSNYDDGLEITVATRPAAREAAGAGGAGGAGAGEATPAKARLTTSYHQFNGGARVWALSPDPLDRELAERVSMTSRSAHQHENRQAMRFVLPADSAAELIGRLARSGRLIGKPHYSLHEGLIPLGWLGDEMFDLKFEIAGHDPQHVRLGLCGVSPSGGRVFHNEFSVIKNRYFIDKQSRLGLFRRASGTQIVHSMMLAAPIVVPRAHAGQLIAKVMSIPLGLPIEFVDCDDVRPEYVTVAPKPKIHISAPEQYAETLEAEVEFDYGGMVVPLGGRQTEAYDRAGGVMVRIDPAFHERSHELLSTLGVRTRRDGDRLAVVLPRKKLPTIVAGLISNGWHVEADGKLYRTGSAFDIKVVSGIDWFELQGKAHFDDANIDLPRLLHALRNGEQTVTLDDGSVGLIPNEWLGQFGGLLGLADREGETLKFGRSQVGLLDALLAQQAEVDVDEQFAAAKQALAAFDRIVPQDPPAGFVGELRPYQNLALGWFEFLRTLGLGGCLADDMGLGKTIQVLALLEQRRQAQAGPCLVVVPRSLIFNWMAEAAKFCPHLRVLDQSHSQRQKTTDHLTGFDVVLTTYGTLRRDAVFLKDFQFDYVVLDEAQAIKNPDTEAAKAARLIQGRHKLALSGTPIENHIGELWSLFDFLNPGMLGRAGRFASFSGEADDAHRKWLAAAVRPFILRRTKRQVAPELPERVEQTVIVELDAEQRRAYDELREYYRQALLNKIDAEGIGRSQIVILEALLRLRQAACHPGLIDKSRSSQPSAKVDELLDRLTTAIAQGERVLVFSQFTTLLTIVKARLKKADIDFLYLDGKTKDRQTLVEQFQTGIGPAVFLISLKAGGVGLNLTAARNVYLLDPWWNPAVEAQAIDRAHRIGQHQTVFATRLIAADTVEQKVLELQSRKRGLADAIINADNAGIGSLTREDLELLLM